MKILDNLAINIANRVNAKNDEVMLLTQENDSLRQKLAASELTVSDYQKKIGDQDIKLLEARRIELVNSKEIDRLHKNQESLVEEYKKKIKDLVESGERQVDIIQEYSEQTIKLQEEVVKLKKAKVSERYKLLKETCDKQLGRIDTYEFISDESNRQTIIDNFSHNLSVWIKSTSKSDGDIAKKLDTTRSIVNNLRNGKRSVNVNTIQKFDIKLCEYFECSVYELVTVKMEGKKNDN